MSLIKCPECGKEISDRAKSCPNCGYSIYSKYAQIRVLDAQMIEMVVGDMDKMIEGRLYHRKEYSYFSEISKIEKDAENKRISKKNHVELFGSIFYIPLEKPVNALLIKTQTVGEEGLLGQKTQRTACKMTLQPGHKYNLGYDALKEVDYFV